MRGLFVSVALTCLPGLAAAQDWATKEVCDVIAPEIVEEVFAPLGRAALEEQAAKIENRRGRLWRIESSDGKVSHLWGTYHSSDPLILDVPEALRDAIAEARVVAVEINYVAPTREDFRAGQYREGQFNMASDPFAATGPGDGTIAGLSLEVSDWIRERAIELGWTEDADLILSPAGMAEMLLSDPCEDFASGVLPIQDDYIQLLGRLAGAEILGLETPDDFFNDLADKDKVANAIIAVYAAYLMPQTTNDTRKTGFALYREGRLGLMAAWDAAYLDQVLGERGPEALALTDGYLLTFRNMRFIEKLRPELDQGGVVTAVGAGHIAGKTGLVALLRGAGYRVERVVLPGEAK